MPNKELKVVTHFLPAGRQGVRENTCLNYSGMLRLVFLAYEDIKKGRMIQCIRGKINILLASQLAGLVEPKAGKLTNL